MCREVTVPRSTLHDADDVHLLSRLGSLCVLQNPEWGTNSDGVRVVGLKGPAGTVGPCIFTSWLLFNPDT